MFRSGDGFIANCLDGSCTSMDCNGDCCAGNNFDVAGCGAIIDDCGVCSGGNSGHVANSDMDACNCCPPGTSPADTWRDNWCGTGENFKCDAGYDASTCPDMDEYCGTCFGTNECNFFKKKF